MNEDIHYPLEQKTCGCMPLEAVCDEGKRLERKIQKSFLNYLSTLCTDRVLHDRWVECVNDYNTHISGYSRD